MAPLPYNNTSIAFVDYGANGREHTVQFRFAGGSGPPGALGNAIDTFFAAAAPVMPTDWTLLGARYQVAGTTFSVPWTYSFAPVAGVSPLNAAEVPAFISFVGRSTGGRRVRLFLLGAGVSPASEGGSAVDYRQTIGESANIANMRTAIVNANLVAIDGLPVSWYQYANLGYHAYWQKEVRS